LDPVINTVGEATASAKETVDTCGVISHRVVIKKLYQTLR
jgi:hypothetical protein